MASTPAKNEEKKGSWPAQTTTSSSGGGSKVSVSRSEEFLTRISKELTDEALFMAHCHMNTVPTKKKQTKDQGTQISRHAQTETAPATRYTFCHPFVKKELFPTA
uniref:CDIP transferase, opposite strand n=1 Tax=Jaculus jaculus TaxID=51337 RepID=A0A8C5NVX8_JACJA